MSKALAALMGDRFEQENYSRTLFGFWVYIMTDCMLFGTAFAAFAVLHKNTAGGPPLGTLFDMPSVLAETLFLLVSSFTCGMALFAAQRNQPKKVLLWFALTFLLGASFLTIEIKEFIHLANEGFSWKRSAAMSAFYTLVGTHGLHITTGLLWMIVLLVPVWKSGLNPMRFKRLMCLRLFWYFLDVVWIFIFTIVYLMEAIK
jgi:cytochrome o ubiquinol oxidase, subunit III